jgi:predicted ribosomally synthesized peptide with SipW-like signal peptide
MLRKVFVLALLGIGLLGLIAETSTLAVFTDSAPVGSNSFTTGTVDISTSPASAVVSYSSMAPGDSTTQSLVVSNAGSLQLRYAISSSATNSDGKGLKDQLVLTIKTIDVTTPGTPCDNFDGTQLYTGDLDDGASGYLAGDPAQGDDTGDRTLNATTSETLCFRADLPLSTGNAFQNATTTGTFTFSAEQTVNNP